MRYDYTYEWAKDDLAGFTKLVKNQHSELARNWIDIWDFDETQIAEAERLNIMLAVIKWEIEHDCITRPVTDELYLYYEQLVNGELDNAIDPEERDTVVKDLTDVFNRVFPDGLEK